MELCVICKKNKTNRLMDGGWGKKLPICTDCLTSGRWRELLPAPVEPEPETPAPPAPPPAEGEGHKHRYTKSSDICKVPGCGHVRVPRKKK